MEAGAGVRGECLVLHEERQVGQQVKGCIKSCWIVSNGFLVECEDSSGQVDSGGEGCGSQVVTDDSVKKEPKPASIEQLQSMSGFHDASQGRLVCVHEHHSPIAVLDVTHLEVNLQTACHETTDDARNCCDMR